MGFTLPFTYDMDIKSKIEGWGWGQIWQLTSSWLQISLKTNKGNKSKVYGKMWGRHIVVDHSKGVGVFRIIEWLGRTVYSMTLTYNFLFCFVTLFMLHYLDFLLISKNHLCFDTQVLLIFRYFSDIYLYE